MSATSLHVALYGASALVHDHHEGDGSFAALSATLAAARSEGVTVVVTTPLTRSNARVVGELPRWLVAQGVAAWCVAVPRVGERRSPHFDRVYPRLAMAMPYALHAVEQARRMALPTWVRGAPWCVLGPYAARSLPEPPRSYGVACKACRARGPCTGVDAAYRDRFAGDELAPSRLATLTASPLGRREAELGRLLAAEAFVPRKLGSDS